MKNNNSGRVDIGLESSIGGGSLSLFTEGTEVDFWIGEQEVSRSVDLVEALEVLLDQNNFEKEQIENVFVSRGPGSFTGIKIGFAVAKGMRDALGCKIFGVPLLEAMTYGMDRCEFLTAVASGRKNVCFQEFKKTGKNNPLTKSDLQFLEYQDFATGYIHGSAQRVILHEGLFEKMKREGYLHDPLNRKNICNAGQNMAGYIGRYGMNCSYEDYLTPIYFFEADFKQS